MNKGDYRYNYRGFARGTKKPENEVVYFPGVFPPLVDPNFVGSCECCHKRERHECANVIKSTY